MPTDYSKIRVIIADRDDHLRNLIREMLRNFGFIRERIRTCKEGSEALLLLTIERADLVITGMRMTPMDGLTLIRRLRDPRVSPAPGIPIILCSAVLDKKLLHEVWSAGANGLLTKPVSASAIKIHIDAIIDRPEPIVQRDDYIGPDRRRAPDRIRPDDRRVRENASDDLWEL